MPPCRCWQANDGELAAFRGPELRDRDVLAGRQLLGKAPDGLPSGEAHRLDVDVSVGGSLVNRLEAADGAVELYPLATVFGRHLERAFDHAELHHATRGDGSFDQPAQRAVAVAVQTHVVATFAPVSVELGVRLSVRGGLGCELDAVGADRDKE